MQILTSKKHFAKFEKKIMSKYCVVIGKQKFWGSIEELSEKFPDEIIFEITLIGLVAI